MFISVLMILTLRNSTYPQGEPYYAIAGKISESHFDYIAWELGTIHYKIGQSFAGEHAYINETERSQMVRTYFDDLTHTKQIETQIETIYTDPNVIDPQTESADLRAERDTLRASLYSRQTTIEAILEGQVAVILIEAGFGIGGQLIPPMSMRFIGQTQILVASPRDKIDMEYVLTLEPIPVDERERIESEILTEQNLSSVIIPIGGMALYPAMIVETPNLSYIIETFAHEWLHHYLMFYPLGWETELFQNGESRIINETTASIFGRIIGRKVLERYYPELVPSPAPQTSPPHPQTQETPQPPAFDFNSEMHQTRIRVDDMLASGTVEEAEAYMEARRKVFWDNGYRIRKLNQAWFAFYGGYQVEGISAGGEDPIGPAVQTLFDSSPTIRDWIITMRTITTRDQLLQMQINHSTQEIGAIYRGKISRTRTIKPGKTLPPLNR